jgi:hypothetical protein
MYLHKQLQITGGQLTQTDHQLICSYHKTWKMSVRLTILLFQVSLELELPLILLWKSKLLEHCGQHQFSYLCLIYVELVFIHLATVSLLTSLCGLT